MRFKSWYTEKAEEARHNQATFPDEGLFRKWSWNDECPVGPYIDTQTWWTRATLSGVQDQLRAGRFPRGDYQELAELINIILGGKVTNYIYFVRLIQIMFYVFCIIDIFFSLFV